MNRKIITAIVTGLLVLSLGTGAMAASQGPGGGGCQGQYFVDEDGDGVCDNLDTGKGQGGQGRYLVDEDGDGVCDNRAPERARAGRAGTSWMRTGTASATTWALAEARAGRAGAWAGAAASGEAGTSKRDVMGCAARRRPPGPSNATATWCGGCAWYI